MIKIGKDIRKFSAYSCQPKTKDELDEIIKSRIDEINKEINELREKENTIENEKSVLEKYTEQGIKHIEKLDRFTIDQLISKIIIGKKDENNNRPIKIFWNFTI